MAALAPTRQELQQQLDRELEELRVLDERRAANPHLSHWKLEEWVRPGRLRRIERLRRALQ